MEIPYIEPLQFNSGDTVKWKRSDFSDFPQADGFTVKYTITGNGGNKTIVGTFADGEWTFELTAAANNLPAGNYKMYGFATKGSGASEETYPIYPPTFLNVMHGFKTASTTDIRTHAEIMVDKLETFLERVATNPVHELEVSGRRFSRSNIGEANALLNRYRNEVKAEEESERRANGETVGEIEVTFPNEL